MKRKPSPATVISLVALFFSLGGVGLASQGGPSPSYVVRDRMALSGQGPLLRATCRKSDRLLSGGYIGSQEVVTASGPLFNGWMVLAHADSPTASSNESGIGTGGSQGPWVEAYAECQTG